LFGIFATFFEGVLKMFCWRKTPKKEVSRPANPRITFRGVRKLISAVGECSFSPGVKNPDHMAFFQSIGLQKRSKIEPSRRFIEQDT
jgi:hypothetical protein